MKETELCKGMRVCIKTAINTRETHTVNNDMEYMISGKYKIQEVVEETSHGIAAQICGFWWHPADLVSLEKPITPPKEEVVNFDIKELVL